MLCAVHRDETRGKEIGVTSDRYRNYTTQQTPTNIVRGGKRKNRELRVLKRRNLSTEAYNIDSVSVIYTMSLTTNSSYSRLQCASKAPVVEWCITISNQFSFFFLDGKNRQNVGFAQFKKKTRFIQSILQKIYTQLSVE